MESGGGLVSMQLIILGATMLSCNGWSVKKNEGISGWLGSFEGVCFLSEFHRGKPVLTIQAQKLEI